MPNKSSSISEHQPGLQQQQPGLQQPGFQQPGFQQQQHTSNNSKSLSNKSNNSQNKKNNNISLTNYEKRMKNIIQIKINFCNILIQKYEKISYDSKKKLKIENFNNKSKTNLNKMNDFEPLFNGAVEGKLIDSTFTYHKDRIVIPLNYDITTPEKLYIACNKLANYFQSLCILIFTYNSEATSLESYVHSPNKLYSVSRGNNSTKEIKLNNKKYPDTLPEYIKPLYDKYVILLRKITSLRNISINILYKINNLLK